MTNIAGGIMDVPKLGKSLCWFVMWAKRQENENKNINEDSFYVYDSDEFENCPYFYVGFFALIALRKEIARVTCDSKIEICVSRLAKIKL